MSENFSDPLLVSIYDDLNPWAPSDEFYYQLAMTRGGRVLDLSCGTGMLACRLAKEGMDVVGVDPAPAMLEVAQEKPGGDRVRWHESDAQSLNLEEDFQTVIMTGHVFQVILNDIDLRSSLQTIVRHLAPEGVFAFESRNPRAQTWLDWRTGSDPHKIHNRIHGEIEVANDSSDPDVNGVVQLRTLYRFTDLGETRTSTSPLRFIERDALETHLKFAGFSSMQWFGGWIGEPFHEESPEIVVVAGI